jgi:predicted RNA-binding protein YlxR (DUF448 family)
MPVRRIPQRTCVACGATRGKRELLRVVRTPDGQLELDPTGRRAGRGAYLCREPACVERALKGRLEHALAVPVPETVAAELRRLTAASGG